jgi:DNA-binding GntR family transcriptional regulator
VAMSGAPRWQLLANQIEQEIRAGIRAPGSKLPSLAEQKENGYSQTTTLRAYRELTLDGLAAAVHGSGTYVADPIPAEGSHPAGNDYERRLRALEERVATLESGN